MRSAHYTLANLAAYVAIGFAAYGWGRIHEQDVLDEEKRAVIVLQKALTVGIEAVEEIRAEEETREHSIVVTPLKAI